MELNLRGRKKATLAIEFPDPFGTVILPTPIKAEYDRIEEMIEEYDGKGFSVFQMKDAVDGLFLIAFEILCTSRDFHHSKEELEELIDMDEAREIIRTWNTFILNVYSSKNA